MSRTLDRTRFENHKDVPIYVNEDGEFSIDSLPFTEGPALKFANVRAARRAIDADYKTQREAGGSPVVAYCVREDKAERCFVIGVDGRGNPKVQRPDGSILGATSYSSPVVYPAADDVEEVLRLEKAVEAADAAAQAARVRLGKALTQNSGRTWAQLRKSLLAAGFKATKEEEPVA